VVLPVTCWCRRRSAAGCTWRDEAIGANVVGDADRAAKGIAKQLSALFAKEGWTS
jgi:hypothetical protein